MGRGAGMMDGVSSTPRPDPDDLPDSLPEDAEAEAQRHQDGAYTAETPERRAASGAPSAERSSIEEE
jgi:hypothetical protein